MPAQFIPIGEPAHDLERQGIRFLVDGLPSDYVVYGNPWLVERSSSIFELDAVVVAPHGIFVIEIKAFRGRIEGTDHDWWKPDRIRSPLKLNRVTAQKLRSELRNRSFEAGQVWIEGFVFLSATTDVGVRGPASNDRVHTRKTILGALQDPALIVRLSQNRGSPPAQAAQRDLLELFVGAQSGPRPVRHVREYEILETLEHHDAFTEHLGRNALSSTQRVLRIYTVPALATEEQRERIRERARWEAQVLGRLGRCEGILAADPPFADEAGIVLPMEHFPGITLTTWVERYGPDVRSAGRAELPARLDLWLRIAQTLDEAHRQGVVHRLLRPEVVLVEDTAAPTQVRITGFDLAKQLTTESTVAWTSMADERLIMAAPEVISAFSSAEPASDQFSLGALLALLLIGKPLFPSTRELVASRRLTRRVRDVAPRIPLSLDEAVERMLAPRPTDRFPTLAQAIAAVARQETPALPGLKATLDPDHLETGVRLGADYEIIGRLGAGGMSVVYAARHLVSGRTRALKIARADAAAEEALRGEHQVLSGLSHPNIVSVIDLTKMVEGRLTLVMERVGDQNLRQWLSAGVGLEPATQRRLAEDLIAGLTGLEEAGITHKDLKPDNLLVHDGHLTLIDFSLARMPEDAMYGGTALYRDPASPRWTHGTDRYAAALCLFELYAGRHAFDGRAPEPGAEPQVSEDDITPSGLAAFFKKALHPEPERRFPSARALRDALLVALGEDAPATAPTAPTAVVETSTPLGLTGLSRRACGRLNRAGVHTVGELLALGAAQIRSMHAIGTRTAAEIIAFQKALMDQGLVPTAPAEPPLFEALCDSPEPISRLALPDALATALLDAHRPTVGAVAALGPTALRALPGFGPRRIAEVIDALRRFHRHANDTHPGLTLDRLWNAAAHRLTDAQRDAVERCVGLMDEPETQARIAEQLGKTQPQISADLTRGIEALDLTPLHDPLDALDALIDGFGGLAPLSVIGARCEESWPPGLVTGAGLVRLLVRVSAGRLHLVEIDEISEPILARPTFDRLTLRAFATEVIRLASQWPPAEPDSAARALAGLLPHFGGDLLTLGVRLCDDVSMAETGHLFVPPLDPSQSLPFVLGQTREPIELDELERRVRRLFGEGTPWPDPDHLLELLRGLDCQVQGTRIIPGRLASVFADPALPADAPTTSAERSPETTLRDMLREAALSRGFRMLVTPPEDHTDIGPSVARALAGTWLSFEDAFFSDHGADLPALERAERFAAQREALTEAAEATLFRLLEEHGRPGRTLILGDTALLGLCDALDLPRRLYDETLSGQLGFWVLVVPGVIHNRQPRFNEGQAMWHLEGATFPLHAPLS